MWPALLNQVGRDIPTFLTGFHHFLYLVLMKMSGFRIIFIILFIAKLVLEFEVNNLHFKGKISGKKLVFKRMCQNSAPEVLLGKILHFYQGQSGWLNQN